TSWTRAAGPGAGTMVASWGSSGPRGNDPVWTCAAQPNQLRRGRRGRIGAMTPPAPLRAAVALAFAAVAVAGCDVRLETPDPTAPEPGPVEIVRDGAAGRSAELSQAAAAAAATDVGDAGVVLTR